MKKKRLFRHIAAILALSMISITLVGCKKDDAPAAGSAGTSQNGGDEQVYTLSCAYELADDHVWAVQFQAMKEELAKESNGRLNLELYGNGTLGAESQLITQLMSGSLDMMPTSVNNISASYPPCLVLAAPYGIKNLDDARKVLSLIHI